VLVEGLPTDSAFGIALRDGNPWTDDTYLLHDISSRMRDLTNMIGNLFRKEGSPAVEVTYLPRPADGESVEDAVDAEVDAEYQARLKAETDANMQRMFANPN
jgi:hypothetical protein